MIFAPAETIGTQKDLLQEAGLGAEWGIVKTTHYKPFPPVGMGHRRP